MFLVFFDRIRRVLLLLFIVFVMFLYWCVVMGVEMVGWMYFNFNCLKLDKMVFLILYVFLGLKKIVMLLFFIFFFYCEFLLFDLLYGVGVFVILNGIVL